MPQRMSRALGYAVLIWITGFAWGSVVFMTPTLWNISAIPYVSRYPAISFPLLIIWPLITYALARSFLRTTADEARAGLQLGLIFAAVNFVLDLLILVLLFKNGPGYFISVTIWLSYFILLIVPWLVGRSLANRRQGSRADVS